MAKRKFIPLNEAVNTYGIDRRCLHTGKCTGAIPEIVFKGVKASKDIQVDINYFLRRKEFQEQVYVKAQENYLLLADELNDAEIAELILNNSSFEHSKHSWQVFFNRTLFKPFTERLTRTKLSIMLWRFYRVSEKLIKQNTKEIR